MYSKLNRLQRKNESERNAKDNSSYNEAELSVTKFHLHVSVYGGKKWESIQSLLHYEFPI